MKKYLFKIKNIWNKTPLSKKFSFLILVVLAIPTIIVITLLFDNYKVQEKELLIENAQKDLDQIDVFASTNGDMASSIVQLICSNPQLIKVLSNNLSVGEIVDFNNDVTPYLENIMITNPYVSSLRIYIDTDILPERYPIYIDKDRVSQEQWFIDAEEQILKTRIGYSEKLSDYILQFSNDSMISFYEALISSNGEKSVIEVAFEMPDFFGDIYSDTQNGICLIKSGDDILINDFEQMKDSDKDFLVELISSVADEEFTNITKSIGNHQYLISYKYSDKLKISYYIVNDLTANLAQLHNSQVSSIIIIAFLFIIFGIIFHFLSKLLLSRIYNTISAMRSLETGNKLALIENPSQDEIGQLQSYFNKMLVRIDELIVQESQRAVLEKNAEIKALQNQINSHFLYNVLNNIEMMAIIDENFLIADTVTALARLLRYSMNWSRQMVSLSSELNYVKDYIQLFNMRFDNSIILICDISEEAKIAQIPKMSVQPIIENAIVHGIENLTSDELIRISAIVKDGVLTIGITDTGSGMNENQLENLRLKLNSEEIDTNITGIGLHNVNERIERRFGKEFGISIESKIKEYTKVTLKLPFSKEEE